PLAHRAEALPPGQDPRNIEDLRILVVDDEPDARELLREMFEHNRATVFVAANAKDAFGLLRENRFDIVVSDIGMPDEDGYELIQRVRALPRDEGGQTPAVALTAYAGSEERKKALLAGFNVHIA